MTQEALRMALEALEWCHGGEPCGTAEAIAVVEKALAQRTWVGLTKEEVFEICNSHYNRDSELVEMVEAKLKELNDHSI